MTKEEQRRFDVLVDNLRLRLRPICENWPDALFDQMIRQLAEITVKYEVDGGGMRAYDRRGTDRLVADLKELLDRSERHRDEAGS